MIETDEVRLVDREKRLTGVIALGDSAYGDTFCQGGEQMRELLLELQGRAAQPMLRLDASETVTPDTDAEPWVQAFITALRS